MSRRRSRVRVPSLPSRRMPCKRGASSFRQSIVLRFSLVSVTTERKLVTVLFCDLADSTGLGERLDAEALQSVQAAYFDRMRAVVEHHGGTVEKFAGDAVLAVFGVPTLHE